MPQKLILVANRDEFYNRPTLPVHFWADTPDIIGGKDLKAGGSWLAVSKKGRFAAITNYRETPIPEGKHSRGDLVKSFLTGDSTPEEYIRAVAKTADEYAGFNLIIANKTSMYYYSNRLNNPQSIQKLEPGVYGLCNHLLDTPWPKLKKTKGQFAEQIQKEIQPDQLIRMMRNNEQASPNQLPDTGVGFQQEKLLSSCFIASDHYGTRNTSILLITQWGQLQWTEQNYLPKGEIGEQQYFEIHFG